jgi:hypothetical protein
VFVSEVSSAILKKVKQKPGHNEQKRIENVVKFQARCHFFVSFDVVDVNHSCVNIYGAMSFRKCMHIHNFDCNYVKTREASNAYG